MQSNQIENSDCSEGMSSWTVISDNLATMENLALSCRSGKICCLRVIVAYKICQVRNAFCFRLVWTCKFWGVVG